MYLNCFRYTQWFTIFFCSWIIATTFEYLLSIKYGNHVYCNIEVGLFIGTSFVDMSVSFVTYLLWLTSIWPNSKLSSMLCHRQPPTLLYNTCSVIDNNPPSPLCLLKPPEAQNLICADYAKLSCRGWFCLIFLITTAHNCTVHTIFFDNHCTELFLITPRRPLNRSAILCRTL